MVPPDLTHSGQVILKGIVNALHHLGKMISHLGKMLTPAKTMPLLTRQTCHSAASLGYHRESGPHPILPKPHPGRCWLA